MSEIQGVVAVYVHEGDVVAHAADFHRGAAGGCSQQETQIARLRDAIAVAVFRACCSPLVGDHIAPYYARQVLREMPGKVHYIPIGYETSEDVCKSETE